MVRDASIKEAELEDNMISWEKTHSGKGTEQKANDHHSEPSNRTIPRKMNLSYNKSVRTATENLRNKEDQCIETSYVGK